MARPLTRWHWLWLATAVVYLISIVVLLVSEWPTEEDGPYLWAWWQWDLIVVAVLAWAIPLVLLYLLGWAVVWVRRSLQG